MSLPKRNQFISIYDIKVRKSNELRMQWRKHSTLPSWESYMKHRKCFFHQSKTKHLFRTHQNVHNIATKCGGELIKRWVYKRLWRYFIKYPDTFLNVYNSDSYVQQKPSGSEYWSQACVFKRNCYIHFYYHGLKFRRHIRKCINLSKIFQCFFIFLISPTVKFPILILLPIKRLFNFNLMILTFHTTFNFCLRYT